MEKKNTMKAIARRMGATLMAFVLLMSVVTPAREAFATEFDFGGGLVDAVKSVEETQPLNNEMQGSSAPAFSFDGGKEAAQTDEVPVFTQPAATQPSADNQVNAESDAEEPQAADADVFLEQGTSVRYSLSGAYNYEYHATPSAEGLTFDGNWSISSGGYVTVAASETTPAGIYTVSYGYTSRGTYHEVGTFTVEVLAKQTGEEGGDEGGSDIGTPDIEETQKMTMDKVVEEILDEAGNPTGKYDLSLSLSGSVGSQTNKAKVDVVFVVDSSGSMYDSNYMTRLRPAMVSLVNNLSSTNGDKIDARYSIAVFGSTASVRQNFSGSSATITSINGIDSDLGGTNYQYGIYRGKELLNQKREGSTTVVIFVTDGIPTFNGISDRPAGNGSNDNGGRNYYGYGSCNAGDNINAAVSEISSMNCNYFYCIGIGSDFADSSNMNKLTAAVNAESTGVYAAVGGSVSELNNVFNSISAEVTSFLCSDVTIQDTMSNVGGELIVEVTDPSTVTVEVQKDGVTIAGPAASVTLPATESNAEATLSTTYDAATGVLQLDFPDTYQLEKGYTYYLRAVIEPTNEAYEYYRENGYDAVGADGTGTYENKEGIHTNKSATVTYTYKDETDTVAYYSHPVIQLHPGSLVINKKIENMDVNMMEILRFPVVLTTPGEQAQEIELLLTGMTYDESTGVYTMVFDGLTPGTTYTVTENGGEVAGYTYNTTINGKSGTSATGTVGLDETVVLDFVNTYVKTGEELEEGEGTVAITGEKIWDDMDDASGLRPESISVKLQGYNGTEWVDIKTIEVTADAEGKWIFSEDVSSYDYIQYRFEETVPEYYEVTYEQPAYAFSCPAEWADQTSVSELAISGSDAAKTIVVSKKGDVYYVWSYDALSEGEQKLISDSYAKIDSGFSAENVVFFYGEGFTIEGITVTADKLTYINPAKWSSVYVGTYSRGTGTSGIITNKLSSTDVTVTKDVSGNLGDRSLNFNFTATLSTGSFAEGEGYTVSADGKTVTFDLKHAESVVLKNVPLGAELTITEESSGYTVTVKVGETEYNNGDAITVTADMQIDFFNVLSEEINTGISLDSVPYIMMLMIAGAAFIFVMMRKRMAFED